MSPDSGMNYREFPPAAGNTSTKTSEVSNAAARNMRTETSGGSSAAARNTSTEANGTSNLEKDKTGNPPIQSIEKIGIEGTLRGKLKDETTEETAKTKTTHEDPQSNGHTALGATTPVNLKKQTAKNISRLPEHKKEVSKVAEAKDTQQILKTRSKEPSDEGTKQILLSNRDDAPKGNEKDRGTTLEPRKIKHRLLLPNKQKFKMKLPTNPHTVLSAGTTCRETKLDATKRPYDPHKTTKDSSVPIESTNPENLMDLTSNTDCENRQTHKLMILQLFSASDASIFSRLEKNTDERSLGLHTRKRKRDKFDVSAIKNRDDGLRLLPSALEEFRKTLKKTAFPDHGDLLGNGPARRTAFSSRSICRLQSIVETKFANSDLLMTIHSGQQTQDKSQPKKKFKPFSLEYNECSVTAIATWAKRKESYKADSNATKRKKADNLVIDRPTVPALFRKCQVCGYYGHYEIECNQMNEEDAICLAHQTMVHANRRELDQEKIDKKDLPFRHLKDETNIEKDSSNTDELEEDSLWQHVGCDVCHSDLDGDKMLICDGCDKLFHLYCLNPPLNEVPKGDWFCNRCADHNKEVASDVEIEACGEFVIEQRKRPRLGESDGQCKDWERAIAVVPEQMHSPPTSTENRIEKNPRIAVAEEQINVDGFLVRATSYSGSELTNHAKAKAIPNGDISRASLVPGSVVAWFPPSSGDGTQDSPPLVGDVLAVHASSRLALVREIDEWEKVLIDNNTDDLDDPLNTLETCSIRYAPSGSTFWYLVDDLHMVAQAASKATAKRFRDEILPLRIERKS